MFMFDIASSLAGIPAFLLYFAVSGAAGLIFMRIYTGITPHDEVALIKENNPVAAITYVGTLLGFVLPLASALVNSVGIFDFLVWIVVAAIAQIVTFVGFRAFYPKVSERIKNGEYAVGIKLAGVSLAVGILNAASMTY
jgi:putative membrane protein